MRFTICLRSACCNLQSVYYVLTSFYNLLDSCCCGLFMLNYVLIVFTCFLTVLTAIYLFLLLVTSSTSSSSSTRSISGTSSTSSTVSSTGTSASSNVSIGIIDAIRIIDAWTLDPHNSALIRPLERNVVLFKDNSIFLLPESLESSAW